MSVESSRTAIGLSWTLLTLLVIGAGCEREPSSQPPTTTKPPTAVGSPDTESQPTSTVQVGADPQAGADAQDAADAPRALPRSGQVPTWIKSRGVQLVAGKDAPSGGSDPRFESILRLFRAQRIASCQYQSGSLEANVVYVETSPHEALGLFTVLSADPRPILRPDGSMRGHGAEGSNLHTAWQGGVYVQVATNGTPDGIAQKRLDQLIDRIVFALPSAEPPVLLRIVPRERRDRCRVWVTQTTQALSLTHEAVFKGLSAGRLDALLGLGKEATLSVAAIDVVPGEPHLIWLVEYQNEAAATLAHTRYAQAIKDPTTALDRTTALDAPRGAYLAGTWTKQQEALQPILPLLVAALPDAEPTATRSTTPATQAP